MPYVLLLLSVFGYAALSVFGGFFSRRCKDDRASAFYNFILVSTAALLWGILFAFDTSFDAGILAYAIAFGFCYAVTMIGTIMALKTGMVALTSLFVGFSLIAATIYGFFFWQTPVTVPVIAGLVLVSLSLFLCLYKKNGAPDTEKNTGKEKSNANMYKWLLFVLLAFSGNAGCTILQRSQQLAFNGAYGNGFMFVAMCISAAFCFALFMYSRKSSEDTAYRRAWYLPVISGACNVMLNVCILLLVNTDLSEALIYPTISVGGLGVTLLFSLFAFRERLTKWQWCGIGIGAVAVVLLSI